MASAIVRTRTQTEHSGRGPLSFEWQRVRVVVTYVGWVFSFAACSALATAGLGVGRSPFRSPNTSAPQSLMDVAVEAARELGSNSVMLVVAAQNESARSVREAWFQIDHARDEDGPDGLK